MKEENLPLVRLEAVVVVRKHHGATTGRVRVQMRDGTYQTTYTSEWPSGRPTPSQLEDFAGALSEELTTAIVSSLGVQLSM